MYLQENSYMVFLYEGMAEWVQDFVTLRIGSLWLDVPLGSIQASNNTSSLRTTAALPVMTGHEQEVNSASQDDFTPVVSKATKRRARRAAAKAREIASEKHTINVRKAASPHSASSSWFFQVKDQQTFHPQNGVKFSPHHSWRVARLY